MTMSPPPPEAPAAPRRWASIDAWRGLVMFLMMAEALEFCAVSRAKPDSSFWKFLCHEQTHAPWRGCSLHDLIQPSFSFLVGVALPFSLASRAARGQSRAQMTRHALGRAFILTALGVLLRFFYAASAAWTFEDTLSQIGMGYFVLFCLGFRPVREQWIAAVLLLAGYWAAFALYPAPVNFNYPAVGVPSDWPQLMTGFAAHWNKNSNLAAAFDKWFLNIFPRPHPFLYNAGGYTTLAFIPTLATMIFGLIGGGVLRGERPAWAKARWFVIAGLGFIGLGLFAEAAGICPIVKRIWTPSWTLYSGGWCFLFLAGFYVIMDIWAVKRWAFPLVVVGANSIVAYVVANTWDTLFERFGFDVKVVPAGPYASLVRGSVALLAIWTVLYILYRRKIFIRI